MRVEKGGRVEGMQAGGWGLAGKVELSGCMNWGRRTENSERQKTFSGGTLTVERETGRECTLVEGGGR